MAIKVRESIDKNYNMNKWVDEKKFKQKYKYTKTYKMLLEEHESLNFMFNIDQHSNIKEKIYDKDLFLKVT